MVILQSYFVAGLPMQFVETVQNAEFSTPTANEEHIIVEPEATANEEHTLVVLESVVKDQVIIIL